MAERIRLTSTGKRLIFECFAVESRSVVSKKSETTWKVQVAENYFKPFVCTFDEKWIDLLVEPHAKGLFAPFLWAEAKKERGLTS